MSNNLTTSKDAPPSMYFSTDQTDLIKRTICKGATDDELALFIGQCKRTGLDPFSKQVYAVKRWDKQSGREVMAIQTSIDGFRVIAERTNTYEGQCGPFWCGDDGIWKDVWIKSDPPVAAKVGVFKSRCREAIWGVAVIHSYIQKNKEGTATKFWQQMPDVMLAKCAEALALRKAFPHDLSGIYTADEMGQADNLTDSHQKIASITGAVVKKIPAWSDDQKIEIGSIFSECISIGGADAEKLIMKLRSTMKYDEPSDVIDAASLLLKRLQEALPENQQ